MAKVATILLAAGLSRRMGARNKLLLPVNGTPMIRHMVNVYEKATNCPILVVTGHEHAKVEAALKGSMAATHFNPDYELGQATSVACGLRNAPDADMVLMGLGDQPLLTAANLNTLISAHENADAGRISIPMHNGARGNPIVIPAHLHARLLEDPRAPGCKKFTRSHPDHVQFQNLTARGFYTDIDTPEAYENLVDLEESS